MKSHKLTLIVLLLLFPLFAGCASSDSESQTGTEVGENRPAEPTSQPTDAPRQELDTTGMTDSELIHMVMSHQQDAWNRGDIEGFMEGYWKSDDLIFTSGGRIRRGWQATLDSYKAGYTEETMGQLAFTDLKIVKTADNEAVVVGRWALSGLEKSPQGGFTLVFRKFLEGWRIIRDHTTSD